jgi:hypothetical protein
MVLDKYSLVPAFSLSPSKLCLYNKIWRNDYNINSSITNPVLPYIGNRIERIYNDGYDSKKRFHNFIISDVARKKMIEKINWLYFMSKSRYKKAISGVEIHNFRISFITLTLPSKQVHPTAVITKVAFNQLLTELRQSYGLQNFVWRLEFQQNKNVHYHLVTDTYVDYYIILKIWNRCVAKMGYVEAYRLKHCTMSLQDYCNAYNNNNTISFDTLKYRYAKGKASRWVIPNSVDVKSVAGQKKIAFYISKYFSKKGKSNAPCNELDNIDNAEGLRLWYCSRSLSKLDKIKDYVQAFPQDILALVTSVKDTFHVIADYCEVFYFSFASFGTEVKGVMHRLLYSYAKNKDYIPSL